MTFREILRREFERRMTQNMASNMETRKALEALDAAMESAANTKTREALEMFLCPSAFLGIGGAWRDVLEFHRKLAPQVVRSMPEKHPVFIEPEESETQTKIPRRRVSFTIWDDQDYAFGFILEEVKELASAMSDQDCERVADSLCDLIYVAIRAALIWGIDLREPWREVQRANMAKEGGATREDNKILKPPGWTPPDIAGFLERQKPID